MEDLKIEDDEAANANVGVGPLLPFLATRELGLLGRRRPRRNRRLLLESDEIAEEKLISKDPLDVLPCKLMGNHTRSTFLMVFSPDKELLASTHGDHNIYITEVKTGECVQTLKGRVINRFIISEPGKVSIFRFLSAHWGKNPQFNQKFTF